MSGKHTKRIERITWLLTYLVALIENIFFLNKTVDGNFCKFYFNAWSSSVAVRINVARQTESFLNQLVAIDVSALCRAHRKHLHGEEKLGRCLQVGQLAFLALAGLVQVDN